jgi:hypothetical protein
VTRIDEKKEKEKKDIEEKQLEEWKERCKKRIEKCTFYDASNKDLFYFRRITPDSVESLIDMSKE